jgi:hypothetical protein
MLSLSCNSNHRKNWTHDGASVCQTLLNYGRGMPRLMNVWYVELVEKDWFGVHFHSRIPCGSVVSDAWRRGRRVSRSQRKWDGLWGWLGAPSLNEKVIPRFRSESPHNESGCLIATHNHLSSR